MKKQNLFRVLTISVLFLLLGLNIHLSITKGGLDFFGLKIKIEQNELQAAPEQDFKMSMGFGCICSGQQGNYWASCHLPGRECSIFECTCFSFN